MLSRTRRNTDAPVALVILVDVDNTLLDNDRFGDDLRATLRDAFGGEECTRYWGILERLRATLGYVDYLGALQEFRGGVQDSPALLRMSDVLLDYPFHERLYPHALDVIAHLRRLATTVALSDGDIVFQPRKIARSGIREAVVGEVIVDVHKQLSLDAMQRRYPAAHYAMVDDKPNILADMKQRMGDRLSTVFVRQGHYADAALAAGDLPMPAPDRTISTIAELLDWRAADFSSSRATAAVAGIT